jgi:membrane protein
MQIATFLKQLLTANPSGRIKAHTQLLFQAIYAVLRDLANGQLTMRSMSLSFSTLLSMVPMLAFSFSLLKGFGVHDMLAPMLQDFLAPMGPGGQEVADNILSFVENMNVAVLGSAGLMMLIFTVVSLVKKVEDSFNYIWNVKRGRTYVERIRDYLSVILVGPLLSVSAAGIATTLRQSDVVLALQQIEPMGPFLVDLFRFVPKLIVFAIFVFLYAFIPNTRVSWRAAATGALVAAVLWLIAGWGFTSFVASSSKYTAIYSSFAVLILFLIWLNISWLFILMGANIAYYAQNPDQLLLARGKLRPSARLREQLAMQSMLNIARDYANGVIRWNTQSLALELNIPREVIELVLTDMESAGLLVETAQEQEVCFLPGRSVNRILLTDIVDAVATAGQNYGNNHHCGDRVEQLCLHIKQGREQALAGQSLADLVQLQAETSSAANPSNSGS